MFGLGYQELLLILLIVLILFGAQRLPDLARSLGSSFKEFKKGVSDVKDEGTSQAKKEEEKNAWLPRQDLLLALSLSALTLLSRWPYRARMLYNWDAVQFALALKEYDVAKHQPHPPGYILYVGLGRLLNSFLHDPTLSYVVLAMLASAAATLVVYFVAAALYRRRE